MHAALFTCPLHPPGEIETIAQRMRQTLIEVLGMERGMALYFVAADGSGTLAGDGIVRGAAGEGWMQAQCLHRAATDTGPHNVKLIRLYQKHGYHIVHSNGEMLRLEKCLESYSS